MGLKSFGVGMPPTEVYEKSAGRSCPYCRADVFVNEDWVKGIEYGGQVVGFATNDDPKHLPGVLFVQCVNSSECGERFWFYIFDEFLADRRKKGDTRFWTDDHQWAVGHAPISA